MPKRKRNSYPLEGRGGHAKKHFYCLVDKDGWVWPNTCAANKTDIINFVTGFPASLNTLEAIRLRRASWRQWRKDHTIKEYKV